jgi:hypothetical protein
MNEFVDVLAAAEDGAVLKQARRTLADVVMAVTATGRSGGVMVRIVVRAGANSVAEKLAVSLSANVPCRRIAGIMPFADDDRALHLTLPQLSMVNDEAPIHPPARHAPWRGRPARCRRPRDARAQDYAAPGSHDVGGRR